MSLSKKTNLGKITINGTVLSKEVLRATALVNDKVFLATSRGKLIGKPMKVGSSELAGNIDVYEKDDKFYLTVYIIMNFGASIKNATETVLDALEKEMKLMFAGQDGVITIKIVGVKSKAIAPRDIEVTREYEASR